MNVNEIDGRKNGNEREKERQRELSFGEKDYLGSRNMLGSSDPKQFSPVIF
tara:strand:- start:528 stop:680 length:153 start_codon:yes stop_codon:yes gene_type:complete